MYKPSIPRLLYDICSVGMVFIIVYFAGIQIDNIYMSILFSIFGLLLIMSLIYLPIALWNLNTQFKSFLYGYYYLMLFYYLVIISILLLTKVMFK
jgi:hypothetical protein